MGFQFRYEKLLEIHHRKEDHARLELAAVQSRLKEALAVRDLIRSQIDMLYAELDRSISADSPIEEVLLIDSHINSLRERAKRQEEKIAGLKRDVDESRRRLIEARKPAKTLEKLRERDLKEYRAEEQRQEARTVDELAVSRFGRNDISFGVLSEGACRYPVEGCSQCGNG